MKRLMLSAISLSLGLIALAPMALAMGQVSTPDEISNNATIHDVYIHNLDARNKK